MRMKTIVDALPSIRKIANQDLSTKTLYKVRLLLDKLELHLKFYDEQREKIMQKYCEIKKDRYVPKEDKVNELENDMTELLNLELEDISAVNIPAEDNIKLSYNDLCLLKEIIIINFDED